ncbi:MAG: hypothetical protein EBE86_002975 [Hormoscilla sp. GUM202]|nr:hypothetical protein [Hormoscilla sp. GUM202]
MQQPSRSHVVEVNGVRFQTEIQSVISVPILPWTKSPVRLGIYVTNQTATPLYFRRLDSLELTLIDDVGKAIEIESDILRLRVKGTPYYTVDSGKREFLSWASFIYREFCQLQLKIDNEAGGFYYFNYLKPGKYKLQIDYRGSGKLPELSPEKQASGKVWTGIVTIPFVEFCLGSYTSKSR